MSHHGHKKPPKGPVTGNFSPAPAALHETSQPLGSDIIASQLAKAQANEKSLKEIAYEISPPPNHAAGRASSPPVPPTGPVASSPDAAGVGPVAGDPGPGPEPVPAGATGDDTNATGPQAPELVSELGQLAEEFAQGPLPPAPSEFRRPAESDTDSPSRGIPRPLPADKQITGGWGADGGGGSYYALDGSEIQNVALALMAQLKTAMAQDLRLGIAITYPQVRIRVQLLIDGSSPDAQVNDAKFELGASRLVTLEAIEQDDDDTPADALRDVAGLPKPAKQLIRAGAAHIMVDVAHPLATR